MIDDERVIVGEPFKSFEGNDLYSDNPDGRFRINNYTISQKKNKTFQLTIRAVNISGMEIEKGKADIHPLVDFGGNYGGFATDSYSRPFYPAIPRIKKDHEFTVTRTFPAEEVDYIITVARKFSQ